jgi:hypothetical protein
MFLDILFTVNAINTYTFMSITQESDSGHIHNEVCAE